MPTSSKSEVPTFCSTICEARRERARLIPAASITRVFSLKSISLLVGSRAALNIARANLRLKPGHGEGTFSLVPDLVLCSLTVAIHWRVRKAETNFSSLNLAKPALVNFASSLNSFSSTDVKLKHDLPCIRFFNSGETLLGRPGHA